MSNYRPRYGIPGKEVENLAKRWSAHDKGRNWETADAFIRGCSENGYKKGIMLRRYDPDKPHSPDNSFFGEPTREVVQKRREKKQNTKGIKSPFCENCQKVCPASGSGGCDAWQDYFQKNWDQNIHIAPKKPVTVVKEGPSVFRYEHPDLVREGIVFEGSGSV